MPRNLAHVQDFACGSPYRLRDLAHSQHFVLTETFIRMSLANYLAKHYLTADSKSEKRSKKRKRKVGTASGLTIADDDALGWDRSIGNADDDAPLEGEISCSSYFHRRLTLLISNHQ